MVARGAEQFLEIPVNLDEVGTAGLAVQTIDILVEHDDPGRDPLENGDGAMRGIGHRPRQFRSIWGRYFQVMSGRTANTSPDSAVSIGSPSSVASSLYKPPTPR